MSRSTSNRPLVSVILTTRDRPRLRAIALRCFGHQAYPNRELIVVDDGDEAPVDPRSVEQLGGRLIRVPPGTPLGAKLNHGVEAARGVWCQKMDDDDWYAPEFLDSMMSGVAAQRNLVCRPAIAIFSQFLFFDVARWELRLSGARKAPGATLFFTREDWEQQPFRAVPRDEDVWFVRDQQRAGLEVVEVSALEAYLAVRHEGTAGDRGHTWTHQIDGRVLEDGLPGRAAYARRPEDLLPSWALSVYRPMHHELSSDRAP